MNPKNIKIEWADQDDYQELKDMLLTCFRVHYPEHLPFEVILPDLYQPDERISQNLILRYNQRIVSCVGLFAIPLSIHGKAVEIGGIGGVATLPDYRGCGYMQQLLDETAAVAYQRGYPFSYLSGDRRRYQPWGYEVIPVTRQLRLSPRGPATASYRLEGWNFQFQEVGDASWPDLYQQAGQIAHMAVCDSHNLHLKYQRWYLGKKILVLAANHNVRGHLLFGSDEGIIHAWAGATEAVAAATAWLLTRHKDSIRICLPLVDDPFTQVFDSMQSHVSIESESLAIVNLQRFFEVFQSGFHAKITDFDIHGQVILAINGYRGVPSQAITLQADGQKLQIAPASPDAAQVRLAGGDAAKLFFSVNAASEILPKLPQSAKWLALLGPVPFYINNLFKV